MNRSYLQAYNKSILTASKGELTLMLYNGALKFCNQAVEALEKKDFNGAHNLIMRAQDIIEELQITLDNKYPITQDLNKMYAYIFELLVQGNINKDIQKILEARDFIREFRDLWKEVITNQGKGV